MNESISAPTAQVLDGILARVRYRPSAANAIEGRIAAAILEDPERVARESILSFAGRTSVSAGSVVRFAKLMGLSGYQELRLALAAATHQQGAQEGPQRQGSRFRQHMDEQVRATLFAIDELEPEAVERAASLLARAQRLDVVATGASAAIGHSLLFSMTLLGLHARFLADSTEQSAAASFVGPGDALVAVSFSGRTRSVVDAAARASDSGAMVIALTCNARSPLVKSAGVALVLDAARGRFVVEWPLRTAMMAVARSLVMSVSDYIPESEVQRRRATWTSGRFGLRYDA